jgi:hypothetical protein
MFSSITFFSLADKTKGNSDSSSSAARRFCQHFSLANYLFEKSSVGQMLSFGSLNGP